MHAGGMRQDAPVGDRGVFSVNTPVGSEKLGYSVILDIQCVHEKALRQGIETAELQADKITCELTGNK